VVGASCEALPSFAPLDKGRDRARRASSTRGSDVEKRARQFGAHGTTENWGRRSRPALRRPQLLARWLGGRQERTLHLTVVLDVVIGRRIQQL
jgi:hypothetical protein